MAPGPPSRRRTLRRVVSGAATIAGLTLGLLILLEGLLRLVPVSEVERGVPETMLDTPWGSAYAEEAAQIEMRWEPFTYWRRQPAPGPLVTIDSAGFRDTPLGPLPTGVDPVRVVVLGGSTVWGTGARNEHTLPAEIGRELRRRGVPAVVLNGGESGYVSAQERLTLERLLQRGERPDLVIVYDGHNDWVSALQTGEAGLPQNESNREKEFELLRGPRVKRTLARELVRRLVGESAIAQMAGRLRPDPPGARDPFRRVAERIDADSLRVLTRDICQAYRFNQDGVARLAAAYGFDLVVAWQPVLFSKARRSAAEESLAEAMSAQATMFEPYPTACDDAMASFEGFVNLSAALDTVRTSLYLDPVHLSEEGNAIMARTLVEAAGLARLDTGSPPVGL